MDKEFEIIAEKVPSQESANKLLERLIEVGSADTVFSAPVESGDYKVITAAEARVGMGFGFGGGASDTGPEQAGESGSAGYGSGGGGGGASMARPIAIIEIGPDGARVEPIVDPTKIALAFVSMLISVFAMAARMRRAARR